jgi:mRNA interferase MazF
MEVKAGEIVLIDVPFIDNSNSKIRPAFVLFSDFENIVVIGITSNLKMSGIRLTKGEGLIKESILKLNYIFTLPKHTVIQKICYLCYSKRKEIYLELEKLLREIIT